MVWRAEHGAFAEEEMADAIDASVALLGGPGDWILTSDAGDLRKLREGREERGRGGRLLVVKVGSRG
jgi:hypothetical protein